MVDTHRTPTPEGVCVCARVYVCVEASLIV